MDLGALVKEFGFPLGIAAYFIIQYIASNKEHKADLKGIATVSVTALDKNTDALDKNSDRLERNNEVVSKATAIIEVMDRKYGERSTS